MVNKDEYIFKGRKTVNKLTNLNKIYTQYKKNLE